MQKQISTAELEVMRVLWAGKRAMTLAEIRDALTRVKEWNKSTVQTLVNRLRDKGVIEPLDKYGAAQYVPIVTEEDYLLEEEKSVLAKFGGARNLAIAMVRNGHLTDADIEELKAYFKMGGESK